MTLDDDILALFESEGFFGTPSGIGPMELTAKRCANVLGYTNHLRIYNGRHAVSVNFRLCTHHKENFFAKIPNRSLAQRPRPPKTARHHKNVVLSFARIVSADG